MTELAYMVREDWAQGGTAMATNSARVMEWLGSGSHLLAVTNLQKFNSGVLDADVEAARYLLPHAMERHEVNVVEIAELGGNKFIAGVGIIVLHPYEQRDLDALRTVLSSEAAGRVFVMVWSPQDAVRTWLDAHGALDLHAAESAPAADVLLVAAAELMINEEYHGLDSGRGKDAVVQLLRSFAGAGYPLDEAAWLHAYYAAGGSFQHAGSISKLIQEMRRGVKHRVSSRYRQDIVEILRKQVIERRRTENSR